MNPSGVQNGVVGRELIDGGFMDSKSQVLDFDILVEMLFRVIPE